MKRWIICVLSVFTLIISTAVGASVAEGTTKSVSGFYRSDFTKGVAYDGSMQLSTHGYGYSIYSDASTSRFRTELTDSDVILIHTHGSAGYFTLASGVTVSGPIINSMSFSPKTNLIYISACKTGLSGTSGNVCSALCNKGVDTVAAFEENVTASTDTNGIHRYNSLVIYKLSNGYTISAAMSSAKSQIYAESGNYWGADSYVIYGDSTVKIN